MQPRPVVVAVAALVAAVMISGCSSSVGQGPVNSPDGQGHVSGGIRLLAGPWPGENFLSNHQAGVVVVRQHGLELRRASVLRGHAFHLTLPAGSYEISADVSQFSCTPALVGVDPTHSQVVQVVCDSNGAPA
jgi:hypothetical protein